METNFKVYYLLSLVFSVVSLVLFIVPIFSLISAIAGLVFVILALTTNENKYRKKIIIPLIISLVSIFFGVVYNIKLYENLQNQTNDYYYPDTSSFSPYEPSIDTIIPESDSLMLDNHQLNNLNNSMTDTNNGPGTAPM